MSTAPPPRLRSAVAPVLRATALLLGVLLTGSCVDGDGPLDPPTSFALVLAPRASAALGAVETARVTVLTLDGGLVTTAEVDVDPQASRWEVSLEVPLTGGTVVVRVLVEMLGGDPPAVEFSGEVGPLTLSPGADTEVPAEVVLIRGPADNLAVTSLAIHGAPGRLLEGGSATLGATVITDPADRSPVVFWSSLDPGVVSVEEGRVAALLPGSARVVAESGHHADTVRIDVLQRPVSLTVSPGAAEIVLDEDVAFDAAVLDPRGDPIPDAQVRWRSDTPGVLEHLGANRFRAIAPGAGVAVAMAAADSAVRSSATVTVHDVVTDLRLVKTGPAEADPGGDATFWVRLFNDGPSAVAEVRVQEALPDGLELVAATPSAGAWDADAALWTVDGLDPGREAALQVQTRLAAGLEAGARLVNQVRIVGRTGARDDDPSNDSSSAPVTVARPRADVAVSKSVDRGAADPGEVVGFTIRVQNLGPRAAPAVTVVDDLPGGLEIRHSEATRGSFDEETRVWSVGRLEDGEEGELRILTYVDPLAASGTLTNVARVTDNGGVHDPDADNDRSEAAVQTGPPGWIELAVGAQHACALATGGVAWCWGANGSGQLGDPTLQGGPTPVRVPTDERFVSIHAGGSTTCGLTSGGDAWCWGANELGQAGSGSLEPLTAGPEPVAGGPFTRLAMGVYHSCALDAGGAAHCWGGGSLQDSYRDLGLGYVPPETCVDGSAYTSERCSRVPRPVETSARFVDIDPALFTTCAVAADGVAWCWGHAEWGLLGTGDTQPTDARTTPVPVTSSLRFSEVSGGALHVCGLTQGGEGACWGGVLGGTGAGDAGQLGQGGEPGSAFTPTPSAVVGGLTFQSISAAVENSIYSMFTCGLTPAGSAWCWGRSPEGELGVSPPPPLCVGLVFRDDPCTTSPLPVTGGHTFVDLETGLSFACGLTPGGDILCWGANGQGQRGVVDPTSSPVPTAVPSPGGSAAALDRVAPAAGWAAPDASARVRIPRLRPGEGRPPAG